MKTGLLQNTGTGFEYPVCVLRRAFFAAQVKRCPRSDSVAAKRVPPALSSGAKRTRRRICGRLDKKEKIEHDEYIK